MDRRKHGSAFRVACVLHRITYGGVRRIVQGRRAIVTSLVLRSFLTRVRVQTVRLYHRPPFRANGRAFLRSLRVSKDFVKDGSRLFTRRVRIVRCVRGYVLYLVFASRFLSVIRGRRVRTLVGVRRVVHHVFPSNFHVLCNGGID